MDPVAPLIASLNAEGRPRVWSIVITIFGDLVQHRGGRIATARLQKILERIGIEGGTMRTALSRLAADGWLDRDRQGRNSFYHLTTSGQEKFAPAAGRIYAAPRRDPVMEWTLAGGDTAPPDATPVGPGFWLLPARHLPDHLCVTGALASFPAAFAKKVLTPEHTCAIETLYADIDSIGETALSPLDAVAARTLLIHRWRRLVLRFPDIPQQLLPAPFLSPCPRTRIARVYAHLSAPSEPWLDSDENRLDPMPPVDATFGTRFGRSPR
jgi:phenylacetic acid degradation operon negative regulatory protein